MRALRRFFNRSFVSTLTGGFYLEWDTSEEGSRGPTINIIHLYTWLGLVLLPATLTLGAVSKNTGRGVYVGVVALVFLLVKWGTFALHHFFDKVEGESKQNENENENESENENENENENEEAPAVEEGNVQRDDLVHEEVATTEEEEEEESMPEEGAGVKIELGDLRNPKDEGAGIVPEESLPPRPPPPPPPPRRLAQSVSLPLRPLSSLPRPFTPPTGSARILSFFNNEAPEAAEDSDVSSEPPTPIVPRSYNDQTGEVVMPGFGANHENTNPGSVHFFVDENGEIQSYTFQDMEDGEGDHDETFGAFRMRHDIFNDEDLPDIHLAMRRHFPDHRQRLNFLLDSIIPMRHGIEHEPKEEARVKSLYKVLFFGKRFPIPFDRLDLENCLDRNFHATEVVISVFLAVATALLGWEIADEFHEVSLLFLWIVVAGAQFCLLKSVQPDAHSPMHANRNTAYSRAVYVVVVSLLVLLFRHHVDNYARGDHVITLWSVSIDWFLMSDFFRNFLATLLLWFPIIFLLGWLPQPNTAFMFLLEQVNIHVLGGTAGVNMLGTILETLKGLLFVALLFGVGLPSFDGDRVRNDSALFSLYIGLLVMLAFLASRIPSDPAFVAEGLGRILPDGKEGPSHVKIRLKHDCFVCIGFFVLSFLLTVSTLFTKSWKGFFWALSSISIVHGLLVHTLLPQLVRPYPFTLMSLPLFRHPSASHDDIGLHEHVKIPLMERFTIWSRRFECYILYLLTFLSAVTHDAQELRAAFGSTWGLLLTTIAGFKLFRSTFINTSHHHWMVLLTILFFRFDFRHSESFILDYFLLSFLYLKVEEAILKFSFVMDYVAPWNGSWGSAAHAVVQPLTIPHTAFGIAQILLATFLSSPIFPVVGSALFVNGYPRPVKYWERKYKTKRYDASTARVGDHLGLGGSLASGYNINNLDSIFYEQLRLSLKRHLADDIAAGRWGSVEAGDVFFLMDDRLTALVHIVELGSGVAAFQLRGLEFKGTYCQERELEAINRKLTHDKTNAYCPKLPILPFRELFRWRWNTWRIENASLFLRSYNIILNPADPLFQMFQLRMVLMRYYVMATIYYLTLAPELDEWLSDLRIASAVVKDDDISYADLDPVFSAQVDGDYDRRLEGISIRSFWSAFRLWIVECWRRRHQHQQSAPGDTEIGTLSPITRLAYCLSLVARRVLYLTAPGIPADGESLIERYHALFKGDIRIHSEKDEWVLMADEKLLDIIAKGVRMALRLHLDHLQDPDNYDDLSVLYSQIQLYERGLVILDESDPRWKECIANAVPRLLSLRRQRDDDSLEVSDYSILQLELRWMRFRVIKLNRESVRGLWAGQQHELVFLGNLNKERGSIQQMRACLRNLINQSCDLPIGYPIFVSPLTTSYSTRILP